MLILISILFQEIHQKKCEQHEPPNHLYNHLLNQCILYYSHLLMTSKQTLLQLE